MIHNEKSSALISLAFSRETKWHTDECQHNARGYTTETGTTSIPYAPAAQGAFLFISIFSSAGHSQPVSELSRNETTLYFKSFASDFQKGMTHGVNNTNVKCKEQKSPHVQPAHCPRRQQIIAEFTSILAWMPEAKSLIAQCSPLKSVSFFLLFKSKAKEYS